MQKGGEVHFAKVLKTVENAVFEFGTQFGNDDLNDKNKSP